MSHTGFAPINGANIYYETQGTGHPLILLHAGVADSRMWDDQVDVFAQHYRTVRFDLRGFGQSRMPAGVVGYHEDVAALLDYLELERAHVAGVSFGARVALDFALAYPERTTALVLAAPTVSGDTPSARIRTFWEEEEDALERGDLAGATELNLELWVDGPHRTPEQVAAHVRERVRIMQLHTFQMPMPDDVEERALTPPAIDRLGDVQVPTLVVVGALDLEEVLDLADRLAQEIADVTKVVIPGAAHVVNMEQPEAFNQAVLTFLKGL